MPELSPFPRLCLRSRERQPRGNDESAHMVCCEQDRALRAMTSDRLWSKVKKCGPEECWPWVGHQNRLGYGRLGGKCTSRLIYELVTGPIPIGMFVLHSCDNPNCCNPAHFFVGPPRDNSADMVMKGRSSRGEKRPLAKLTDQQVRAIRADVRMLKDIAADYGVSFQLISGIRNGKRWTHVD
jgi:hypothetical protein